MQLLLSKKQIKKKIASLFCFNLPTYNQGALIKQYGVHDGRYTAGEVLTFAKLIGLN